MDNKLGLTVLVDFLKRYYQPNHEVVVYEAAQYAICKPIIQRVSLSELPEAETNVISTLYVPPKQPSPSIDYKMADRLGLLPEFPEVNSNPLLNKLFRFTHKHK